MSTNNYNVDWGNLSEEANTGSDANFMKLQDGDNQVRIVSSPAKLFIHWEKDVDGKWHKIVCNGTSTCPICQKGIAPKARFLMNVLDRKDDNKVKLLEVGATIAAQLGALVKDPDYGSPVNYDIKIAKSGSGLNTTYSVTPRPKKTPLTDEEKEAVNAAPKIEDVMKVVSPEEIKGFNLECLAESLNDLAGIENTAGNTDDDDDWDDI